MRAIVKFIFMSVFTALVFIFWVKYGGLFLLFLTVSFFLSYIGMLFSSVIGD